MNNADEHKYSIGQIVSLTRGFGYSQNVATAFEIIAQLPTNGTQFQYRIRNGDEKFERVAAENELILRPQN